MVEILELLKVDIADGGLTLLVDECGQTFLVESLEGDEEEALAAIVKIVNDGLGE